MASIDSPPQRGLPPLVIRALVAAHRPTTNSNYVFDASAWPIREFILGNGWGRLDRHRPRTMLLTPDGHEVREKLLTLARDYNKGRPAYRLAERYSVSDRTITRWLVAMDVPIRTRGGKLTDPLRDKIAQTYHDNRKISLAQLAAEYDISPRTVGNILRSRNVQARPRGRINNYRYSRGQQHAVLTANPDNNIMTGKDRTLRALVGRGLATAVNSWGPYRLTEAGIAFREQLGCPVADVTVDQGNSEGADPSPERSLLIAEAWQTMLDHRAALAPKGEPAAWERVQPLRAAAIILEAAGACPSATDEYGRRTRVGYSLALSSMMPWAVRVSHCLPHPWTQVGNDERKESTEIHEILTAAYDQYTDIFNDAGWHATQEYSALSGNTWLIARPAPALEH